MAPGSDLVVMSLDSLELLVQHECEPLARDGDNNRDPEGVLAPEVFAVLDILWTTPERDIPVADACVQQ